jgi:hypothetical protein
MYAAALWCMFFDIGFVGFFFSPLLENNMAKMVVK